MYIYYPSCNFKRNFPQTAARIADYLKTQPDVKIAGCCHVTNSLPKEGDVIVTVCMSCMRVLEEVRPDIPQVNLFEFLLGREDFAWPDYQGEAITLQDCFRARGKHSLQDAMREAMKRMNMEVVELEPNRDEVIYDGSFLLHEAYPQNKKEAPDYFDKYLSDYIHVLPKEEWLATYQEEAAKITTERTAGYCNVCVTSLREGGANAHHLAEYAFPESR
ncbi:MAG: hypothetical protein J6P72_02625 [Firmicutes bacterium]|nr:hypothetical protein [Bacillota bacterium]